MLRELLFNFHNTNLKSTFAYICLKLRIPLRTFNNNKKQNYKILIVGCGTHAISTIIPIILKKNSIYKIFVRKSENYSLIKKIYNIDITDDFNSFTKNLTSNDKVFILSSPENHLEYLKFFVKLDCYIFLEKPLVINSQQLNDLKNMNKKFEFSKVLIGYNRNYSPAFYYLKSIINADKSIKEISYRINFGPKNKQYQNRTIEHVCHYLSFIISLINSEIEDYSSHITNEGNSSIISGKFQNKSIFSIIFTSEGKRDYETKENISISFNGNNLNIKNFKKVTNNKRHITFNRDIFGYNMIINSFLNEDLIFEFRNNITVSDITINASN